MYLNKEIYFCKRCLYSSNHPFGILIDNEGVCSGCRIHEEKNTLDWKSRWSRLQRIISPYRSKSGRNYDCIVPVTGAQDSYFTVYAAKVLLGLNPLLVSYNKYFNTEDGIRNLANLRIKFNCDLIQQNVNPISVKKITRTTLRVMGSIYWPVIAGHTAFPVQTAVRYKIPLIIWGAHQGIEQVGMYSYEHEVEMSRRYRKEHDLMGYEADDLLSTFDTLNEKDIWQYRYPTDMEINTIGVRGIYLNNFIRWDPKAQHEEMIAKYDYRTHGFTRTFDSYENVDCFNYMNLHDLVKLYKHGYSKVTDHATREIRFGRITRDQGIYLVKRYELGEAKKIELFAKWLGLDLSGLNFLLDHCKNKNYWFKKDSNLWEFRGLSSLLDQKSNVNEEKQITTINKINFINNQLMQKDEKYITIGKGWP